MKNKPSPQIPETPDETIKTVRVPNKLLAMAKARCKAQGKKFSPYIRELILADLSK